MGASNPHPHGQIWATDAPAQRGRRARTSASARYAAAHGAPLLADYAAPGARAAARVVHRERRDWLVVVPFWAVWPFETLILPRRAGARLPDLTPESATRWPSVLDACCARYDNLFDVSFPYSMGWHGAPLRRRASAHWQLHAHIYPPLLRSATVRKFMVGYELLAEPQRDLRAEAAAERLRELIR